MKTTELVETLRPATSNIPVILISWTMSLTSMGGCRMKIFHVSLQETASEAEPKTLKHCLHHLDSLTLQNSAIDLNSGFFNWSISPL